MAEDFQPCNDWWNNSSSSSFNGSQAINSSSDSSLSCSTTRSDSLNWLPANKTSESSATIRFSDMNFSTSSSVSSTYAYSSSMPPGLAERDKSFQQPFFDSQEMTDQPYRSQMMACHGFCNETLEPSWNKLPQLFKDFSHKQQSDINQMQLTNTIPFWNDSAEFGSSSLVSSGIQHFESRPGCSMTVKSLEEVPEMNTSNESEMKKPRIETLSPLPAAFKVRKEKLGDKITALQQLVSPFGKTATASVLHETVEYIKYLHDQVNVLSTPYLRNTRPMLQEKKLDESKEGEEPIQDLRSRGLCLVPIASTYTTASDQNTSDFWASTPARTSW